MKNILKTFFIGMITATIISSCNSNSSIEPEMVYVEGGTFLMGCNQQEDSCQSDEMPAHSVTISSFNIGKYEITQEQWKKVMGKNPSNIALDGNYPVTNVSWYDAQEFCNRLNATTGKNYRLPTEAEWEYAARGGNKSKGYKYSGSNNLKKVGWYEENRGISPQPVGRKLPNELGIYDMSGNVYEWCSDKYGAYSENKQTDPLGASSGSDRICHGGSWRSNATFCRIAFRHHEIPDSSYGNLGLRVVLD
jgi:formylglycine-generating enzyme required for sulfatase activity